APEVSADDLASLARGGSPLNSMIGAAEGLVMYVRSSVASYWRAGTFDTFSPDRSGDSDTADSANATIPSGAWYSTANGNRPYSTTFANRLGGGDDGDRYLQTFFVQQDLGGAVVTGYNPVSIAVPRDANR